MAILQRKSSPLRLNIGVGALNPRELLQIAKDAGIKAIPLDVERLALALGIRVIYEPMDGELSGKLVRKDLTYLMTINSLHHPNRQRFTIAHELGHYCLHRSMGDEFIDKIFFRGGESSRTEAEANRFAAAILMPEDEFTRFVKSTSQKIEDIADNFLVSPMAVKFRAEQLGFG